MRFSELVDAAVKLLNRSQRLTYRALQREFDLDNETLADLCDELIEARKVAIDEGGKVLVWRGDWAVPEDTKNEPPANWPFEANEGVPESVALEGERKTITALFADIKGSTALIDSLDPEDARAILDPVLKQLIDAIQTFGGFVAQALGDGVFALFGAPIAVEDHPQRAVRAALAMQRGIRELSIARRSNVATALQLRVGINTGEVVVRSVLKGDSRSDYVPVGQSTNLAARLEQLAAPGSVFVSETTALLVREYFHLNPRGPMTLKGFEKPVSVFEVMGEGEHFTRLQATRARGLSPYTGRQVEFATLQRTLSQAAKGAGQVVGVMGEPGLGKSRLWYEFKQRLPAGVSVLEAQTVAYMQSPYLPFQSLLREFFDVRADEPSVAVRARVTAGLRRVDAALQSEAPYFELLLGVEETQSLVHNMDAHLRRRRICAAVINLFMRASARQPLILSIEDLHWLDPESLFVLNALVDAIAGARILIVTNFRPEFVHAWSSKANYTQIRLAPLDDDESTSLLDALLGYDDSLNPIKHFIAQRTEGTPFFAEEMIQTLHEAGVVAGERGRCRLLRPPTASALPVTVQGVLAARIDRLDIDEKKLLQQLAVLGRRAGWRLIAATVGPSEARLRDQLAVLQSKEFLFEQPGVSESEFVLKHALTQEVAYGTLLMEQRRHLHVKAGEAIEMLFAEKLDEHLAALAHHFANAGRAEKAIDYLQRLANLGVLRGAYADAVQQLRTAIGLVPALENPAHERATELSLRLALDGPLAQTAGYAAPEVADNADRARELAIAERNQAALLPLLFNKMIFNYTQPNLTVASDTADEIAELVGDDSLKPEVRLFALFGQMVTRLASGRLMQALDIANRTLAMLDESPIVGSPVVYIWSPEIMFRGYCGLLFWMCGFPQRARTAIQHALRLGEESRHAPNEVWGFAYSSWTHQLLRDAATTHAHAGRGVALSREHGFPLWDGWSAIPFGWAIAEQGDVEGGLVRTRDGLQLWSELGGGWSRPYGLCLQAELEGRAGRPREGLKLTAEALAQVARTDERWFEAEINRMDGELWRQVWVEEGLLNARLHALESMQKARHIALLQGAKGWELRAALSLARLYVSEQDVTAARTFLQPIFAWFTEGFDTPDLMDAKALLAELP